MKRRKDSKGRVLQTGEYERPNGTYEYRYKDRLGKYRVIYAPNLQELRTREKEILKLTLSGRDSCGTLTVNDIYAVWLQLKKSLKDNVFQNYVYLYEHWCRDTIGNIRINELKRSDIRSFYNTLYETYHCKISSLDNLHTVLHQVIQVAVDDDYIPYNPADGALKELKSLHPNDSIRRKSLSKKEETVFENYLFDNEQTKQWYPMFEVMLWTGLRASELCGLQWDDIDFEKNVINVQHNLVYYAKKTKDGQKRESIYAVNPTKTIAGTRTIPMLNRVRDAFIKQREWLQEADLKCTVHYGNCSDFVFLNKDGGTFNQSTINRAIHRIVRDCNDSIMNRQDYIPGKTVLLPRITSHVFRHTFATRMAEYGVNIKAAQYILGHEDIQTTYNIYVDALPEFNEKEIMKFDRNLTDLENG